jgi:hypothetical protein
MRPIREEVGQGILLSRVEPHHYRTYSAETSPQAAAPRKR